MKLHEILKVDRDARISIEGYDQLFGIGDKILFSPETYTQYPLATIDVLCGRLSYCLPTRNPGEKMRVVGSQIEYKKRGH